MVRKTAKRMRRRQNPPRGPRGGNMSNVQAIFRRELNFNVTISSTAGSVINNVVQLVPTTFFEAANMAHLFDEYRICGATVQFFPLNPWTNDVSGINGPLVIIFDNDDASAVSSYSEAYGHDRQKRVINLANPGFSYAPYSVTFRRPSSGKDTSIFWYNLQSPTPYGSIKLYADSISASTVYGTLRVILHTEFRGMVNV